MPSLTNRLKLALPNGNEYVNRAALNKIFEDIDRLVMLQSDFDTAKKEIDGNLAKKVSKSGDTMTGSLKMTVPATGSVGYGFQDTTGAETSRLISVANGNVIWQDRTNLIDVLTYSPINKTFTMQADTNLLKKTGDAMTGTLQMENNIVMNVPKGSARTIRYRVDNVDYISEGLNSSGDFAFYDQANQKSIWGYYPATNTFQVSANTNLLKKTGDTMTDKLWFEGAAKGVAWKDNAREVADLVYNNRTVFLRGKPLDGTVYNAVTYDIDKNYFNVQGDTNLLKKTGDTMTGNLVIGKTANGIVWKDNENMDYGIITNSDGKQLYMRDWKRGKTLFSHDDNGFNVYADNLLKKTGDTATGHMLFRGNIIQETIDGATGIQSVINDSVKKWAVAPKVNGGAVDWSKELSMSLITGEVSVPGLKVKGERALTISDGEEKTPSRSGKDENGIFTTYEETQEDGKLWKRSVLSSPDADGNYLVRTVTYYKDGVAYKTKTFDLKYDEDGDFVKAVPR